MLGCGILTQVMPRISLEIPIIIHYLKQKTDMSDIVCYVAFVYHVTDKTSFLPICFFIIEPALIALTSEASICFTIGWGCITLQFKLLL